MFGLSKLGMKAKAAMASAAGLAVAVYTTALTMSGGLVQFENADQTAIDNGVGNALQNIWAGFVFILPYVGVALGVVLVIGIVFWLTRKAGGAAGR